MQKKLEVLKKVAKILNDNDITWNLGASCMLYLRGIVEMFDDIDIMVSEEDVLKVESLFSSFESTIKPPNNQYKTKRFIEYVIDGVDIDVMAGFIIVNKGKDYYFPLSKGTQSEKIILDGVSINLESAETWLRYYELMERKDKVILLKK